MQFILFSQLFYQFVPLLLLSLQILIFFKNLFQFDLHSFPFQILLLKLKPDFVLLLNLVQIKFLVNTHLIFFEPNLSPLIRSQVTLGNLVISILQLNFRTVKLLLATLSLTFFVTGLSFGSYSGQIGPRFARLFGPYFGRNVRPAHSLYWSWDFLLERGIVKHFKLNSFLNLFDFYNENRSVLFLLKTK